MNPGLLPLLHQMLNAKTSEIFEFEIEKVNRLQHCTSTARLKNLRLIKVHQADELIEFYHEPTSNTIMIEATLLTEIKLKYRF